MDGKARYRVQTEAGTSLLPGDANGPTHLLFDPARLQAAHGHISPQVSAKRLHYRHWSRATVAAPEEARQVLLSTVYAWAIRKGKLAGTFQNSQQVR